jgi:hypothetical protein
MKKGLIQGALTLILCGVTLLIGCTKDEEFISAQEQLELDIVIIDQYLLDNNITAIEDPTGLRYVIDVEGTGDSPDVNDNVTVNYEGRLMSNGTVFDSNEDISFSLSSVIAGWQIGFPHYKEGGSGTLYIPSGWAYGRNGQNTIPGNSILIFDIELLKVN